jgi:YD repeat-containing protein
VTFNGSASSDPDGTVANYKWDLDGNGSFETDTGASATATKSYATSGNVQVGLQVTDNDDASGQDTSTVAVTNRAPTASFTASPNPVPTGQSVTFNGSASSDPDGTVANYKWDLDGNGSFETDTGATPQASRTYTALGSVTVRLQVTDNNGSTGTTSQALLVRYTAKMNFQPAAAPIPSGYTADSGAAYSAIIGRGWIREDSLSGVHIPLDLTKNTIDRNLVTDQRLDTFIAMDPRAGGTTSTKGAWEIAVPNGSYTVTVAVGDALQSDSTHRINIEGLSVINNFKPSPKTKFLTATKTVTVSDGRLTVDSKGGTNTKLDYVDIASN